MPKLEQFFEKTLVRELCLKNELITIPIEPMLSTKRVCLKQSNGRIEHTGGLSILMMHSVYYFVILANANGRFVYD